MKTEKKNIEYLNGHLFKMWMNVELDANAKGDGHGIIQDILDDVCTRADPQELAKYLLEILKTQVSKDRSSNVEALLKIINLRDIDIDINANTDNSSKPITLFNSANDIIKPLLTAYDRDKQLKRQNKIREAIDTPMNITQRSRSNSESSLGDDWIIVEKISWQLKAHATAAKGKNTNSEIASISKRTSKAGGRGV
jgi:hypothetical protein